MTLPEVQRDVLGVIQSYLPRRAIDKGKELIRDSKMHSDDATAMINELERKYKINIPAAEWKKVATPQDVIRRDAATSGDVGASHD